MSGEHLLIEGEAVKDLQRERVREFLSIVVTGSEVQIQEVEPDIDFTEEDSVRNAMKRFISYEYSGNATLYMNPLLGIESQRENLSFEPYISRGGKRSRHGVFFGQLGIGQQAIDVAVKPHDTTNERTKFQNFESAVADYFKTYAVKKLGIFSLTPAALFLTDEEVPRAYSMTVLKEGLTTLDSIDWTNFFPRIDKNPGMQQMWINIAEQLACFHDYSDGSGYKSHGDMAPRNIASTPDEGEFFIDWESASFHSKPPRDVEVSAGSSYTDLSVLFESMCLPPHANVGGKNGIGIFYGKTDDWWEGFRDIFWNPYTTMRRELVMRVSHKAHLATQLEEELAWLETELQADAQMYRAICDQIFSR